MNFLSKGNLFYLHKATIPKQDGKDLKLKHSQLILEFFKEKKKTPTYKTLFHITPFWTVLLFCFLAAELSFYLKNTMNTIAMSHSSQIQEILFSSLFEADNFLDC